MRWPPSMRLVRWVLLGCAGVLVLALAAVGVALMTPLGRATADAMMRIVQTDELNGQRLDGRDAVVKYLVEHPDRFALAAWDVGAEDAGVFHDADRPWPLASTVKIVPLALASERLAAGEWATEMPTPEVEALYLPGTDRNAHLEALAHLDGGTATLGGALTAMIRFSDNAATDAVLLRLGRPAIVEGAGRLGVSSPPHPLAGTLLLARSGFDGGAADDAAWAVAERLANKPDVAMGVRALSRLQDALSGNTTTGAPVR